MSIENMKFDELEICLDLVRKVFMEFEAPDYSEQGIHTFLEFIGIESIKKMYNDGKLQVWVYREKDHILGMIASRNINHICMLFVDKEYHRQGIARRLFERFVEEVRKNDVNQTVTVNSSPYAVGFYHKMGFKESDNELEIDGIRFVPMKMAL